MTISAVPKSARSFIAIESLKNEHNTAANLGYANTPARKPYHTGLFCSHMYIRIVILARFL